VHEETLTGRPHDTSVQKATSDKEMCMQFNVMPWKNKSKCFSKSSTEHADTTKSGKLFQIGTIL